MKHITLFLGCILGLVAACSPLPAKHYRSPGQPESLLDKTSEKVSFGLKTKTFEKDLTSWLDKDQPTRAMVACNDTTQGCKQSKRILKSFNVPFESVAPTKQGEAVTLIYDRLNTRKCQNQFISNHHNFRNTNHPSFGCSVSTNSLLMINEVEQLVNPPLSGMQDAEKAVNKIDHYRKK